MNLQNEPNISPLNFFFKLNVSVFVCMCVAQSPNRRRRCRRQSRHCLKAAAVIGVPDKL